MKDAADSYDVIIIGAGHNGLVAAYYLACAGQRVLVVESRAQVGGCCVTEELIPGYRFSTCANVLWALRPKILRDLELRRRGLIVDQRRFIRLQADRRYLFTERQSTLAPGEDLGAVQRQIAKFSAADAAAFPRWQEFQVRLTRVLGPWLLQAPPSLDQLRASCADPEDRKALDLALNRSIAALSDSFFESDIMRDVAIGADMGESRDVGTGLVFALQVAMGSYTETGESVLNGFVRGGMGRVTELMAEAATEAGAAIALDAPVAKILTAGGKVLGIRLKSGEECRSRFVISTLDPKRTFLTLLDPAQLDSRLVGRVRALETRAAPGLKFHAALSEVPDLRLDGLTAEQQRESTVVFAPGRDYRLAAWRAAERGELPSEPVLAGMMPSIYDPSLAPPGKYTWSAYVTWAPAKPRRGTWAERREEMGEGIIRVVEKHTTNFRRALIDFRVLTPDDIVERYGLTDGNIHHIDAIPSQMLGQRPLEEMANYRGPIAGLYLGGSGSHPGGEVSGAPGHNAAHAILSDLKIPPSPI